MRILVSVPAVSYEDVRGSELFDRFLFESAFEPSGPHNLDVFSSHTSDLRSSDFGGDFLGLNIPSWDFESQGGEGVLGPGIGGKDLVFWPDSMEKRLKKVCAKYDRWRPYPAEPPLSSYNISMANRFCRKRLRMFDRLAGDRGLPYELLMYVEHSPASLVHLDRLVSTKICTDVLSGVLSTSRSIPHADVVIFSPYGFGGEAGFVLSNTTETTTLSIWAGILDYMMGEY